MNRTERLPRLMKAVVTASGRLPPILVGHAFLATALSLAARAYEDRPRAVGIYVSHAELGGADVVRIAQFPGWAFCIDAVHGLLRERQFTSVVSLEEWREVT
jgi:hypothetical protein